MLLRTHEAFNKIADGKEQVTPALRGIGK